jgi:hypothetical protein
MADGHTARQPDVEEADVRTIVDAVLSNFPVLTSEIVYGDLRLA